MRPWEIVVAVVDALGICLVVRPRRRATRYAGPAPLIAVVLQLVFEGMRWQLVPAYLLAGLVAALLVWRPGRRFVRAMTVGSAAVVLAVAVALPIVFPVFRFPMPKGPYGIGTVTYHWSDTSRHEIFATGSGGAT